MESDDLPLIDGLEKLPPDGFELPRPPDGLQDRIFALTARQIRTRSRRRVYRLVAAALVVYAAGFFTSRAVRFGPVEAPTPARSDSGVESIAANRSPPAADPDATLRRVRSAPPPERPRLLKQAGDEYLIASGDLDGALHCYRQFLEIASDDERTRSDPGDTWLLGSLKQGRTTNRRN
jgi:hypothetical protein